MLDLLKFAITAKDRTGPAFGNVKKELGGMKGMLASVQDQAMRTGRSMRNMGAGMTAGVTAPILLAGKNMVNLYNQQVEAENAVQGAIASTGGAAGKTLSELKGLASGLQELTTFGDEDILRNVTAPLLTFTKIQGDIFDEAQANVLDMATLLKMDLRSASILVGKALNDPVKGVSALGRSGVQFAEDQKGMIKSLVETGDVAAAQTLILKELKTQFIDQAKLKALAPMGQIEQLQGAIGDVKELFGEQIIPFIVPVTQAIRSAVDWFGALSPEVKRNIVIVGGLAAAVGPLVAGLGLMVMGVTAVGGAFATIGSLLLANPLFAAIAAVAGGGYLIYRNWDGISGWFREKWALVRDEARAGWQGIKAIFPLFGAAELVYRNWEGISEWFALKFSALGGVFATGWGVIKGVLSGQYGPEQMVYSLWRGVGQWFSGQAGAVLQGFRDIWSAVTDETSTWPEAMKQVGIDVIGGLVRGLKDAPLTPAGQIRAMGGMIIDAAKDVFKSKSPSRVFMGIGKDVVDGLAIGVRDNAETAVGEAVSMTERLRDEAAKSTGMLATLRDGAKSVFTSVLTGAQSFKGALSGVLGNIGSRLINTGVSSLFDAIWPFEKGGVIGPTGVQAFAKGGVVSSPTLFGMPGGTGLMGEAGPEAILPLSRGADGRLGVRASGGGGRGGDTVNITFAPTINAEGADRAEIAVLRQQLDLMAKNMEKNVQAILIRGRNRRQNLSWQTA